MKCMVFLLALCAIQVIECNSFDFRRLFGSSSEKVTSPSIAQTSSTLKNIFENEDKQNNVSFSVNEDLDLEHNVSISASDGYVENVTSDSDKQNELNSMNNLTDEVFNGADSQSELSKVQVSSSKIESSSVPSSSESSTEDRQYLNASLNLSNNVSSITEEPEEVVLKTNSTTFTYITKTMYQKTVELMGDTYTLSILIPVVSGILFALTIILTIATCRCIKKKCRRRRFRKRVLPDSIKNLRPSDQARLLGDCCDSSDEF